MRKIINGKKYDTETATLIGSWCNYYPPNNFNYCSEDLYKKKTGEFFLYGEGGARTIYAKTDGDFSCGGWEITPIDDERAKEWAEKNLTVEEYELAFGEVEE